MSTESSIEDIVGSGVVMEDVAARAMETDRKTKMRRMRRAAGLSQTQLGEAAGWSQPYVSRMERFNGVIPSLDVMARWASACGYAGEAKFYSDTPDDPRDSVISVAV